MAEAGPSSQNLDPGGCVSKCHREGCICCQYIPDCISTFKWKATGISYKIKQKMDCMTPNVIYVVECNKTQAQWIGKTSSSLHDRFNAHWPIPDNYQSEGHSLDDLRIYPIEPVDNSENLDKRELFWIDTVNKGQNLERCRYEQERPDDDTTGPGGSALGVPVESSTLGHKRKHTEHDHQKSKRKKKHERKNETEQLLSQTNDAHKKGKDAFSQLYTKLKGVIQDSSFLEDLKKEITNYDGKEKIHIGLFGQTGSGKSSLINAIVGEDQLLPVGTMQACTSVYVYVQASAESSKYSADIEFLTLKEWTSELQLLLELIRNENDQVNTGEKAKTKKMAEDTITAIYGEKGLRKNYNELVTAAEDLQIYKAPPRLKNFNTAGELSEKIECYIRSNRKAKQQFWPLVKRVTINLPKSSALPEGIVLIDLPGAGDINKQRCNMWKECLSQCSSVWIVSKMKRALDEDVALEIFDESLRTIAGGGVCHNITYICTQIDDIDSDEIIREYEVPSAIKCNPEGPEGEKRQKQQCILYLNDVFKKQIDEDLKKKIKEFLHGDSEPSDEFFSVFPVSSKEYKRIAQGKDSTLEQDETGIPSLIEHIKKLYISHHEEEVKHYISEVYVLISLIHGSKDAIVSKGKSSYSDAFKTLEKDVNEMCKSLQKILEAFQNNLKESLDSGAKEAEKKCEKNALDCVLEPEGRDNRGYHMTLKAMCRNSGFYRTGKGKVVDLNQTLSEPMNQKINLLFKTTFGVACLLTKGRTEAPSAFREFKENLSWLPCKYLSVISKELGTFLSKKDSLTSGHLFNSLIGGNCGKLVMECAPPDAKSNPVGTRTMDLERRDLIEPRLSCGMTRTSINRQFESFQIQFIKNEDLRSYRQKDKNKYWRLLYIRAKQRKLISTLKKEILQRKKLIYNSLSDSIQDTMSDTYAECSEIKGKGALEKMKRTLKSKVQNSKTVMFHDAKDRMLKAVDDLKEDLVKTLATKMTTSVRMALFQMPDDITVLPDVTEELEKIKECCKSLKLEIFEEQ